MNAAKTIDDSWLTPKLSLWIDLFRILAAAVVFNYHSAKQGLYNTSYDTVVAAHNAVIVFFVLSGVVVAHSVYSRPSSLKAYIVARLSRIIPVAWGAVIISAIITLFGDSVGFQYGVKLENNFILENFIASFFFQSENIVEGLPINPPYWSLCYEFWYYFLFAGVTFLSGFARIAFLAVGILLAGPLALLLAPVWFAGVWLVRTKVMRDIPEIIAIFFVTIAIFALFNIYEYAGFEANFHHEGELIDFGFSRYFLTDYILGSVLILGFIGLRRVVELRNLSLERWRKPIKIGADMSFSLYILHWPLVKLLLIFGITAGDSMVLYVIYMLLVAYMCYVFSRLTEFRRPLYRAYFERALNKVWA